MVLYPVVAEVDFVLVSREGKEVLSWSILGEGAGEGFVVEDGSEESDRALVGVDIEVEVEVESLGGPAESVADVSEVVKVPGEDEVEWLGSVSNEVNVESEVDEVEQDLNIVLGGDFSEEHWVHDNKVVLKHVPEDWHFVSKIEIESEVEANSPSVTRIFSVPVEGLNSWEFVSDGSSNLSQSFRFLEWAHGEGGGGKGSESS